MAALIQDKGREGHRQTENSSNPHQDSVARHARKRSAHMPPHDDAADAEAFERAMVDVVRLGPDPRGRIRRAPPVTATPVTATPAVTTTDDGASASDHEYAAAGVDRRE